MPKFESPSTMGNRHSTRFTTWICQVAYAAPVAPIRWGPWAPPAISRPGPMGMGHRPYVCECNTISEPPIWAFPASGGLSIKAKAAHVIISVFRLKFGRLGPVWEKTPIPQKTESGVKGVPATPGWGAVPRPLTIRPIADALAGTCFNTRTNRFYGPRT